MLQSPNRRPLSISLIGWPSLINSASQAILLPFTWNSPESQALYADSDFGPGIAALFMLPAQIGILFSAIGLLQGRKMGRLAWHISYFLLVVSAAILMPPELRGPVLLFSIYGYASCTWLLHTPRANRFFDGEEPEAGYPTYDSPTQVLGILATGLGILFGSGLLFMITMAVGDIGYIIFTLILVLIIPVPLLYLGIRWMGPERMETHVTGALYLIGSMMVGAGIMWTFMASLMPTTPGTGWIGIGLGAILALAAGRWLWEK